MLDKEAYANSSVDFKIDFWKYGSIKSGVRLFVVQFTESANREASLPVHFGEFSFSHCFFRFWNGFS